MPGLKDIHSHARNVARTFQPERVVLFGSYAVGQPTEDSDVDLLVVMDHAGGDVDQAFAIRRSVPRNFSLDLVVRTPAELTRRLRQGDTFLTSIWATGKTLYDRGATRVDQQGGR